MTWKTTLSISSLSFLLICLISLCSIPGLQAQHIGEVLLGSMTDDQAFFKIDRLPKNTFLGESEFGNVWNLVELQSAYVESFELKNAESGKSFPTFPAATHLISCTDGSEYYFKQEKESRSFLGAVLSGQKDLISLQSPLAINIRNSEKDLPSQFVYSQHVRSGQVTEIYNVAEQMRSKGILYLPDSESEAIKIERIITKNTAGRSEPLETRTQLLFLDEVNLEVLALVDLNESGEVSHVVYKTKDLTSAAPGPQQDTYNFKMYPSVSFGDDIRLDFRNFVPGAYSVEIYNVIGRKIWQKDYDIYGDITLSEDLSFLGKGTYIYSLMDQDRNKISTRRIAIIKP